jgi:hypothetical protein
MNHSDIVIPAGLRVMTDDVDNSTKPGIGSPERNCAALSKTASLELNREQRVTSGDTDRPRI